MTGPINPIIIYGMSCPMILPPATDTVPATIPANAKLPTLSTVDELDDFEVRLRLAEARGTMRRVAAEMDRLVGRMAATVRPPNRRNRKAK